MVKGSPHCKQCVPSKEPLRANFSWGFAPNPSREIIPLHPYLQQNIILLRYRVKGMMPLQGYWGQRPQGL